MSIPMVNYPNYRPYSNVQPFTIRDGATYLMTLEALKDWIRDSLVPHVNKEIAELAENWEEGGTTLVEAWESLSADLIAQVQESVDSIGTSVDDALTAKAAAEAARDLAELYASQAQDIQDAAITATLDNPASLSRALLDTLYVAESAFSAFQTATENRLTDVETLAESKASMVALTGLTNTVNNRFASNENAISQLEATKANLSDIADFADVSEYVAGLELNNQTTETIVTVGARRVNPVTGIHSAFPSHVITPDNRIIAVYRESTTEQPVNMDGVIRVTMSDDGGNTWTSPQTIIDDALDLRDPNISLIDGTFYLTYFPHNGTQPLGVYVATSEDGETWTAGSRVDPAGQRAAASAPVIKHGDYLFIPYYGKTSLSETFDTAWVLRSSNGTTWERFTIAAGSGRDYQEPNLAVIDNQLIAIFRYGNNASLGRSISVNNGQTWTAPESVFSDASGKPALAVVQGLLFVLYRRVMDGKPIIRFSRDNGVTWSSETVMDPESVLAMAYGSMAETTPGLVSVLYSLEESEGTSSVNGSAKVYFKYLFVNSGTSPLGDIALPKPNEMVAPNTPVVWDSFERPDGSSLGVSDSGHVWDGSGFGLSVGALYPIAAGVSIATVDAGVGNCEISADFNARIGGGVGLVARYVSANTYLMFVHDSDGRYARLYKVVSGTTTQIAQAVDGETDPRNAVAPDSPYRMTLKISGRMIRGYIDGYEVLAHILSISDAMTFGNSTRYGIRMNKVTNNHSARQFTIS